ncbi:MAG: hypothetical protein FDX18_09795 [Chlorobium sp.]|nr:MAG: hypothetical protein FDX18_09795 [Chlorobium sp.]
MKRLDLRRYPYRGIIKELAAEFGKAPCTIHLGLFGRDVPSPKYLEAFQMKLEARIAGQKEAMRKLNSTLKKGV